MARALMHKTGFFNHDASPAYRTLRYTRPWRDDRRNHNPWGETAAFGSVGAETLVAAGLMVSYDNGTGATAGPETEVVHAHGSHSA